MGRRPGLVRADRPARADGRRDQRAGDEPRHRAGRRQRHPPRRPARAPLRILSAAAGLHAARDGRPPGPVHDRHRSRGVRVHHGAGSRTPASAITSSCGRATRPTPGMADEAAAVLGGPPELVLVDSSHAYSHTLAELGTCGRRACPSGALVLLHDASEFATAFDPTAKGGVRRAIAEWLPDHPAMAGLTLNGARRARRGRRRARLQGRLRTGHPPSAFAERGALRSPGSLRYYIWKRSRRAAVFGLRRASNSGAVAPRSDHRTRTRQGTAPSKNVVQMPPWRVTVNAMERCPWPGCNRSVQPLAIRSFVGLSGGPIQRGICASGHRCYRTYAPRGPWTLEYGPPPPRR